MAAVTEHAAAGGVVIGICNGFQVLAEAGLLPGALQKNRGLKFLCRTVALRVERARSALTTEAPVGTSLHVPINHVEGTSTCSPETLPARRAGERVVFRCVDTPKRPIEALDGI